jgi:phosphoenolpyruvate synthase/pyruvate phosphate dikinase
LVQVFDEYAQQHPQLAGFGEYYEIGAVFNSPRACLRAETIARHVAFAAFSADDLTALTFGCERQDAEKFFPQYIYDKIYLVSAEWYRGLVCVGRQKCFQRSLLRAVTRGSCIVVTYLRLTVPW